MCIFYQETIRNDENGKIRYNHTRVIIVCAEECVACFLPRSSVTHTLPVAQNQVGIMLIVKVYCRLPRQFDVTVKKRLTCVANIRSQP